LRLQIGHRGAPKTLGINRSDVTGTYLIVEPPDDPTTPGAVSLSAYVSADYGSGYIKFGGDGTVERSTSRPDASAKSG
jgi:hypothetical protein